MMLSYVPQRSDLPATFESLNDDTLTTMLQFVGNKSYRSFGGINKHCRVIYLATKGMTKETFMYGYGPLPVIKDKIERATEYSNDLHWDYELFESVGKGVVFYGRKDVMDWALQEQNKYLLRGICTVAAGEERFDLLEELWNHIENDYEDEDDKSFIFRGGECPAAIHGKQELLKWYETKGLSIDKKSCAKKAAEYGQLHILQWLREEKSLALDRYLYNDAARGGKLHILKWLQEEKGLELDRYLYNDAARGGKLHILKWLREEKGLELDRYLYVEANYGGHFHVMKWLREQGCPWDEYTFYHAALKGNLNILQWLHDEGCPWPEDDAYRVFDDWLKTDVIDWCRMNGYRDRVRVYFGDDDDY